MVVIASRITRAHTDDASAVLRDSIRTGDNCTTSAMKIKLITEVLEQKYWPPWKAFSEQHMAAMHTVCPEGQISIFSEDGTPQAYLNMQRIKWDGNPENVPSWNFMMKPSSFEEAYNPSGDTLMMLNICVNPEVRGSNLPAKLIDLAKQSAQEHGITRIAGLFRPTEYGTYKNDMIKSTGAFDDIEVYSRLRNDEGKLADAWLRNLEKNGMVPIGISRDTYTTTVSVPTFAAYAFSYNPSMWLRTGENSWECGQCGSWTVDKTRNSATYSESRVIGIVWESASK